MSQSQNLLPGMTDETTGVQYNSMGYALSNTAFTTQQIMAPGITSTHDNEDGNGSTHIP